MNKNPIKVVFLSYENAISTSISLPMELFKAAETLAKSSSYRQSSGSSQLELQTASVGGAAKLTHAGLNITDNTPITEIDRADVVFLPGLWRNPFPVIKKNYEIIEWLKTQYDNGQTKLVAVGTGCCLLAEAGLLDHRIATTHWYFFDRFRRKYPKVKLQKNHFITQSGRLYCAGSVNTLADLTVHMIENYYGAALSAEVERHFFHDVRQNYRKLALVENIGATHHDELVLEAQALIKASLSESVDIEKLAARFGMSRRNFDRRFNAATGSTPLRFIQRQRMDNARDLIKNSNLTISEVMDRVGYQDPAHFSALFKKQHGITPRQYRTTVRPKIFNFE